MAAEVPVGGADTYQYLLLMAGCLAITLPLELFLRARVWSRPRRLMLSLAPVVLVFSVWDIVGIARGHWWYSSKFTTGIIVPLTNMPLEELVFFLVIPICGLLTYEAVGTCLRWLRHGFGSRPRRVRGDKTAGGPYA